MQREKFHILGDKEAEGLNPEARSAYLNGLADYARRLEGDVYRDGLTGLYNRRYFDETFEREFRRSGRSGLPLALVLGDLDYFKQINDKYGHLFGDFVLKRVGEIMRTSAREDTDSVCRAGGEEYGLILPYTHLDGAVHLAELIRQKIEKIDIRDELERTRATGSEVDRQQAVCLIDDLRSKRADKPKITVSFGAGVHPYDDITTVLGFYRATDDALYLAKAAGRNNVKALFDLRTV